MPNAFKYTEKSMKASGVTALCDSGEPMENVMNQGRWRSLLTPMHYRNTSHQFKIDITNRIPAASFPKFREIVSLPNSYSEFLDTTQRHVFSTV